MRNALKLVLAITLATAAAARAEVSEVKIAGGFGITNLPLYVMESQKLIEKHAKASGLPEVKVSFPIIAGAANMNDALISGAVHMGFPAPPGLITLWARTRDNVDVRAVSAISSMPLYLNTSNPAVKSVTDFTDKDRIAVPSLKVSIQPILLSMMAVKLFGEAQSGKFDPYTVAMPHPEATTALLSGSAGITAHFGSPPFQFQQLRQAGIRTVLKSYEVTGGRSTFVIGIATGRFNKENPRTYKAILAALGESVEWINRNKRQAAELYLQVTKDKRSSVDDILVMLNDPEIVFTLTPERIMTYAEHMHRTGMIKVKPASWKDLFFPEVHHLPGS